MSADKPVEGDRVRVVLEGTVDEHGDIKGDSGTFCLYPNVRKHVVSIEKIEPPVVTFKPGDVVRSRESGNLRTPMKGGGWFNITKSRAYPNTCHPLTSKHNELVTFAPTDESA